MLDIDGSYGEGGGQILRTSIALSALLGKPISVKNVRINRPKPGLAHQHLTGIKALQDMTDAEVKGLEIGSTEIEFSPTTLKSGAYRIDIGTAGSITLLLQTLLIPSAFSDSEVVLNISGGTDVMWAPPIDYMKNVFYPIVNKMDYEGEIQLISRGYYPKGNGKVKVKIPTLKSLKAIKLIERGNLLSIQGISHSYNLPCHIIERVSDAVKEILKDYECVIELECDRNLSTGCGISLWAKYENSILGASGIGEIGKPAEEVGSTAGKMLLEEIRGGAALDRYMGDQIIPYMGLAEGTSEVMVKKLTEHLKTNIYVAEKILGNKFEVIEKNGGFVIKTEGIGFKNRFL